jgi:hypothetical protein
MVTNISPGHCGVKSHESWRDNRLFLGLFYKIREGVLEELTLAGESQARALRLRHDRDLLGEQAGDVHRLRGPFLGLPLEERMIAVDIDDVSLGKAFRPGFAEEIETNRDDILTQFDPADDGVRSDLLDQRVPALSYFRFRRRAGLSLRADRRLIRLRGAAFRRRPADAFLPAVGDGSERRKIRIQSQGPVNSGEGFFDRPSGALVFPAVRLFAELFFDDPNHILNRFQELLIFLGIGDEIRAVRSDGKEIGVDLPFDPSYGRPPGLHAEELLFDGDAFDLDVDAQVIGRSGRLGNDDDLARDHAERAAFEDRDPLAGKGPGRHGTAVEINAEIRRPEGHAVFDRRFGFFEIERLGQLREDDRRAVASDGIRRKNFERELPNVLRGLPILFIENDAGGIGAAAGYDLEAHGRGERGELADAELPDAFAAEPRRDRADDFFVRSDAEILPETIGVHADAVVADGNPVGRDIDPNLGRIGVVGVIDEFAEQFDALRVKMFADGNDMTFIDRDFEVLLLDDIHRLTRFDFNPIMKPGSIWP